MAVAAEDMVQAAKLLDKKSRRFLPRSFHGTFEGERFLYDGSTISEEIEGEGLVFTMPEILFTELFRMASLRETVWHYSCKCGQPQI